MLAGQRGSAATGTQPGKGQSRLLYAVFLIVAYVLSYMKREGSWFGLLASAVTNHWRCPWTDEDSVTGGNGTDTIDKHVGAANGYRAGLYAGKSSP
jgi:hypothetical protein